VRLSVHTISKGEAVAAFAVLLGFVVILQGLSSAYASGFGGFPDEPAHLVTSLMVRDFLAGLDFRHPWQFAQQYYLNYPEVTIGVWPLGFYAALATCTSPWHGQEFDRRSLNPRRNCNDRFFE
jgi:hypothetical protein